MDDGGTAVFRLSPAYRAFVGFIFTVMVLGGTAALVAAYSGDDAGGRVFVTVWLAAILVQGWWFFLRMPHRIEASTAGLRFVARTRAIDVPWVSLRSVESPWYDFSNQSLLWRWDGGRLRTTGWFQGFHRLVTLVEQRAPHARLRGL